jgi:hypothetical protein
VVNFWCGSGVHDCAFTRLVPTGFAQNLLAYPCVYQYVYPFGDELQNHYIQQRFEVKFSIQLHDTNTIVKPHQTAGTHRGQTRTTHHVHQLEHDQRPPNRTTTKPTTNSHERLNQYGHKT